MDLMPKTLLHDMWLSSVVIYKFSAEDNELFYNISHAQKWNEITSIILL